MIDRKKLHYIMIVLIIWIFFIDYLSIKLGVLPRKITWVPDIISMILFGSILLIFAVRKKIDIQIGYYYCFGAYLSIVLIGALYNTVPAGAMIAGIRTYFRYIPFFLLPCVFQIDEKYFKAQLRLLFLISLIQVPLTLFQRFIQFKDLQTGDVVTGTINSPSILVIFQLSVITVLVSMYMKGKLSLLHLLLVGMVLFIPCTINETKAVLILLPSSVVAMALFSKGINSKLKKIFALTAICAVLLSIFVPIYDHLIKENWGYGIIDFITMKGRVEGYLYKGATGKEDDEKIGRLDSLNLAIKKISENPMTLFFGLGIGNVNESFIRKFKGEYTEYGILGVDMSTVSNLLWETGVGGVIVVLIFIGYSVKNAMNLMKASDYRGVIALSWIGICAMISLSLIYKNLIHTNVSYILIYLFGYIASENYRFYNDSLVQ